MNVAKLAEILPRAPAAWLHELTVQPANFGIDTAHELASFIAQVAHESSEFLRLEENLNYSLERLPQVWRVFAINPEAPPAERKPNALALRYTHAPPALANFIYADRLGNGSPASGDGWHYKGRGPLQITGRRNYAACQAATGDPVLSLPDLLMQPRIGIRSACWYWTSRKLDDLDDDDDVRAETRVVNGGELGLAERQAYFDKALSILTEAAA
jgi:putative chitinase